ncbi:MAG TPA: hypothetical protein VGB07_18645 [Blastocatellia bacterium]
MWDTLKNIAELALRVIQLTRDTEKNAKNIEKANERIYDYSLGLTTLKDRIELREKRDEQEHKYLRNLIDQYAEQERKERQHLIQALELTLANEKIAQLKMEADQLQRENEQLRNKFMLTTSTAERTYPNTPIILLEEKITNE